MSYDDLMDRPPPLTDDETGAESRALAAAVTIADADPRRISHDVWSTQALDDVARIAE